jgi:gamma-glutamyl phosphate reductase
MWLPVSCLGFRCSFLFAQAGVKIMAGPRAALVFPALPAVKSFHVEYGEKTLALEFVSGVQEAVSHINKCVSIF